MDMSTFFLGFMGGVFSLALLVGTILFWWIRPYMKDARNKMKSKMSDTEEEERRQSLEKQIRESAWGGNDPGALWKFQPRKRNR